MIAAYIVSSGEMEVLSRAKCHRPILWSNTTLMRQSTLYVPTTRIARVASMHLPVCFCECEHTPMYTRDNYGGKAAGIGRQNDRVRAHARLTQIAGGRGDRSQSTIVAGDEEPAGGWSIKQHLLRGANQGLVPVAMERRGSRQKAERRRHKAQGKRQKVENRR